jgi:KUP system potassium uptake protein
MAQNFVKYDPSVFKAFSPYFAGNFLVRNGRDGWVMIGGILLAFTGCEALFADLGAFGKRFICFCFLPSSFQSLGGQFRY